MHTYYNDYTGIIRNEMKYSKFSELPDSDYDYKRYERAFSGRMTKGRWKLIASYCRRNSFRPKCHCSHDCCGHLSMHYMEFEYKHNQIVIRLSLSYNY